ncbi:MAG: acyl-CoA dehydrogenase family protein [Desulfobacterales bacterium]
MITFELTKEQELIVKSAKEFAVRELRDIARDCDEDAQIPSKVLDKAWEIGLGNAAVPEEYGGVGMDRSAVTSVLICEELGYGCASVAAAIMAPSSFIQPVIDFGTPGQKKKYLPIYGGEKFEAAAAAIQEPSFTFDPTDMHTTAVKKGNDWVLNGTKRLVPFGSTARHFLVIAKTEDSPGLAGLGAFVVDRDAEGLEIDKEPEKTMGLKPLPLNKITLNKVAVSGSEKLGGEQGIDGRRLINSIRVANSAVCIGLSRAVLDACVPYAKERIAFGEPIAKRQAIAFMLSEMHAEIESMRWLVWKAASSLDQDSDATKPAALARHYTNKNSVVIADNGVQVFGGHGYIRELYPEMWLRNVRTLSLMEGVAAA